jgi:hypothetical protein
LTREGKPDIKALLMRKQTDSHLQRVAVPFCIIL